jgi:hypothetical protein
VRTLFLLVTAIALGFAAAGCGGGQGEEGRETAVSRAPATTTVLAVRTELVGMWSRNVTDADRRRAEGFGISAGVWKMKIAESGRVEFYATSGALFLSGSIKASSQRVTFNAGCQPGGVYRWNTSGRTLTLAKVKDEACGDRVAVLVGTWKQEA